MTTLGEKLRSPFAWVPTAYLAEGIPFAMVIWVAGTMFKDLGHSDSEITLEMLSPMATAPTQKALDASAASALPGNCST